MPAASTGPIRAWKSGNRWSLSPCRLGTGELGNFRARQCAQVGCRSSTESRRRSQRQRMADLTGAAGFAVRVCCVGVSLRGMAGTISCSQSCLGCPCIGNNVSWFTHCMDMPCGCFGSALLLHLDLRHHHFSRHGFAHPAAQRQQGNQESDKQVAHDQFRGKNFSIVYFCTAMLLAMVSEMPSCSEPLGP